MFLRFHIAMAIFLYGCVFEFDSQSPGFDRRPISIHSVSFFNQRSLSRLGSKSWKGDWVFRRDRLELIDNSLRAAKPDILIVQELMERSESSSESDIKILAAGVLADYDWRKVEVNKYDDTRESESLAVATALPLRFVSLKPDDATNSVDYFAMGKDGHLMLTSIDYEGQPLTIVNVQFPKEVDGIDWLAFVQERALDRLERMHLCPKRIIVAGYLPGDFAGRSSVNLLNSLQIRDTAQGFCRIEAGCFTATPLNDLFLATVGDESPVRVDRILAHRSANVINSGRIFDNPSFFNYYGSEFGLSKLWPTQRFGWHSSLRFSKCRSDELM